jgi:hypothetical protein
MGVSHLPMSMKNIVYPKKILIICHLPLSLTIMIHKEWWYYIFYYHWQLSFFKNNIVHGDDKSMCKMEMGLNPLETYHW